MGLALGELVEFVDGFPRIWEFVANLDEEFVGEVERCVGQAVVEFLVRGVLLLVEDSADSQEVGFVYWCY